jgi:hypothetical protein
MKRLIRKASDLNVNDYFVIDEDLDNCKKELKELLYENFGDTYDFTLKTDDFIEIYKGEPVTFENQDEIYERMEKDEEAGEKIGWKYGNYQTGYKFKEAELFLYKVPIGICTLDSKVFKDDNLDYDSSRDFTCGILIYPNDVKVRYEDYVKENPEVEKTVSDFLNSIASEMQKIINKHLGE